MLPPHRPFRAKPVGAPGPVRTALRKLLESGEAEQAAAPPAIRPSRLVLKRAPVVGRPGQSRGEESRG